MSLQIKDETAGLVIMEISGGAALIGIDGSADSVHLLATAGNVIIKSTGIVNDNLTVSGCATPTTGSATFDGTGHVTVTTGQSQKVVIGEAVEIDGFTDTTFTMKGPAGGSRSYRFW